MLHFLKEASNQGYADASYALALCRRDGCGSAPDIHEARRLLHCAVDQGSLDAQEVLATL